MACQFIGWCGLTPEAQAAWAQAVLTVVTFAFALWFQRRASRNAEEKADKQRDKLAAEHSRSASLQARAVAIAIVESLRNVNSSVKSARHHGVRSPGTIEFLQQTDFGSLTSFATATPALLHAAEKAQHLLAIVSALQTYVLAIDADAELSDNEAETLERMLEDVSHIGRETRDLLYAMLAPQ